ncbi:undecaprenyl-diphosphate phosphatase [Endozoicomonas numazuensis]|uniref:Undecaprenyl-diphosphatase n=1 Tax=Endozoicomonas numazuensis TaxID=1137799 RepID=A0A081NM51_9GAMM|nr:undecaprenyl-diphosphate phosphatase [Endozoicomonas numazuensis]KEQ19524.1 UDP pyrophosphate phosphatase [Endozoicomonas numazuensis]
MDSLQIIILALLQGVTEFLPISSSGHLILPAQLLGWSDQGLAFDVAVHIGTLVAVVGYFRKDLIRIGLDWFGSLSGKGSTVNSRLGWYLIFATLPAILVGFLLKSMGLDEAMRSIAVIAGTTLIFGALLGWADYKGKKIQPIEKLTFRQAMIIGLAQAVALIPGTSRSGITITAGLMLGMTREAAARFSFLLSIPVILGAGLLLTLDLVKATEPVNWNVLFSGALVAAVSAWICIYFFLSFINRIGLMPFVIYRFILGAVLIAVMVV